MQKRRAKLKKCMEQGEEVSQSEQNGPCDSSAGPLVVKLNFSPKDGSRKRISRATANLRRALKAKDKKVSDLKRKVKTLQRSNQRRKQTKRLHEISVLSSPEKSTVVCLQNAGLNPCDVPVLAKELTTLHTIVREVRNSNGKEKTVNLAKVVTGEYTNRTRTASHAAKLLQMNYKKIQKAKNSYKVTARRRIFSFPPLVWQAAKEWLGL